jgi:hypothetical protein
VYCCAVAGETFHANGRCIKVNWQRPNIGVGS